VAQVLETTQLSASSQNLPRQRLSVRTSLTDLKLWQQRTEKRTGGEITTGNHFRAWEESGLKMGTHDFMIVAIEGYFSNGSATINIDSPP